MDILSEEGVVGFDGIAREAASQSQDSTLCAAEGHQPIISHNTRPLVDARSVSHGKVIALRDVTIQEEINQKLQEVNKTLSTINACREAIVHATKESTLLDNICEILVDISGYTLVWVGYAVDDAEKHVRPIAIAGDNRGYVENADIRWSDDPRGLGPTGTAIRTGTARASRNIRTNRMHEPWREQAIERGYESSIALPLREGERAFGALNIYSNEPDAFAADDVFEQLKRLADDIGYAITALRTQAERERTSADLLQQKAQYQSLFNGNPHPMWVQDRETHAFIAVNEAAIRVFEYSREEFLSMTVQDIIPAEDIPDFIEKMSRVEDGLTGAGAGRHVRRDGTVVVTEVTAQAVMFNERQAQLVQAVDVTEQREVEKQLRNDERRLRALVNSAPIGIYLTDVRGRCQFVNEQWTRFAGMTAAEARGTGWEQALHPDDVKRVVREWAESTQSDKPFRSEYRFQTPTGQTTWLAGTAVAIRSESHEIVGFMGTITDISRCRQLETSACPRNALMAAIVSNIPYAICVKDAEDLSYVRVNPAGEAILGGLQEDLIGKTDYDLLDRNTADARAKRDREALGGQVEGTTCDETIAARSGDARILRTQRIPVEDGRGKVRYLLLVSEDITETIGVAPKFAGRQGARVGTIAALRGSDKTDSGHTLPIDINRLLEDTIVEVRDELAPDVQFITDFECDLPSVRYNPDDVRQLVRSLLQGAARANTGTETIGDRGTGTLRITTRHEENSVVIGVGDSGLRAPLREGTPDDRSSTHLPTTVQGRYPTGHDGRVEKDRGSASFDSTVDRGMACRIRLPIDTCNKTGGP